jgi:exopolysaccharide biosynthesis polyprenyl glycosylphosphotransferase
VVALHDVFRGARFTRLVAVTDVCLLWCALAIGAQLGGGIGGTDLLLAGLFGAVAMARLSAKGLYGGRGEQAGLADTVRLATGAIVHAVGVAVVAAVVVSAPGAVADSLVIAGVAGLVLVPGGRAVVVAARDRARDRGYGAAPAIVVGAGVVGLDIERRLRARTDHGLQPVGFLDDAPSPAFLRASGHGPLLGDLSDLERAVARTGAGHVIVAYSRTPDSAVVDLVRRCRSMRVSVSIVPRLYESHAGGQWSENVSGLPLVRSSGVDPHTWQFTLSHALGRVVAVCAIVVAAPLLVAIAAAVRIAGGPGPILFRQLRIGRDGQVFDILKFRTMRVADDRPGGDVRSRIQAQGTGPGGVEEVDRRTAIGKFLRRTSLDELPQLINVLRGHMSLVGPRPERPEFVELFGHGMARYDDRHRVKSGITGWAQVNGLRGQTSLSDRIALDNWYIENWSLWLDLKILMLTPFEVLRSRAESETGATLAPHAPDAGRLDDGPARPRPVDLEPAGSAS